MQECPDMAMNLKAVNVGTWPVGGAAALRQGQMPDVTSRPTVQERLDRAMTA